jgi:hypothetical protein
MKIFGKSSTHVSVGQAKILILTVTVEQDGDAAGVVSCSSPDPQRLFSDFKIFNGRK